MKTSFEGSRFLFLKLLPKGCIPVGNLKTRHLTYLVQPVEPEKYFWEQEKLALTSGVQTKENLKIKIMKSNPAKSQIITLPCFSSPASSYDYQVY